MTVQLSVVIATFNGEATIAEQLHALADQEVAESFEVIVADNGSTDATCPLIESFREKLNLELVDASTRRGQGHARNVAAAVARGEYLVFVDQDDVIRPGYLAAMLDGLAHHAMVGSRIDHESLNPGWIARSRRPAQIASLGAALGYLPYAGGQTLGIRKAVFESVGGFDVSMPGAVEDVDLCWRVQQGGHTLGYVPDAVVSYRYRDTLLEQWRQAYNYGRAEVTLYHRYRSAGMQRRSAIAALRTWAIWIRSLFLIRSKGDAAKVLWKLGHDLGMAATCLRLGVYYP